MFISVYIQYEYFSYKLVILHYYYLVNADYKIYIYIHTNN